MATHFCAWWALAGFCTEFIRIIFLCGRESHQLSNPITLNDRQSAMSFLPDWATLNFNFIYICSFMLNTFSTKKNLLSEDCQQHHHSTILFIPLISFPGLWKRFWTQCNMIKNKDFNSLVLFSSARQCFIEDLYEKEYRIWSFSYSTVLVPGEITWNLCSYYSLITFVCFP